MADPDEVAKKDCAHRTNKVTIEPGAVLDPDYTCTVLENEIGATGRLNVLRLAPSSSRRSAAQPGRHGIDHVAPIAPDPLNKRVESGWEATRRFAPR